MHITIPVRVTSDLSPLLAYEMAKSVRQHMPDATLMHVAETGAEKLEGFDSIMHVDPNGDFVDQLFRIMESIDGNVLSLDYDIILNADVSNVFAQDFDVAFTARPKGDGTIPERLRTTYNMGVVFSKSRAFWTALRSAYSKVSERDGWLRSQTLASQIARALGDEYRVIEVPGELYNYTPMTEHEDVSGRKIVHYKGGRKIWMLPPEDRHKVAVNVAKMRALVRGA